MDITHPPQKTKMTIFEFLREAVVAVDLVAEKRRFIRILSAILKSCSLLSIKIHRQIPNFSSARLPALAVEVIKMCQVKRRVKQMVHKF